MNVYTFVGMAFERFFVLYFPFKAKCHITLRKMQMVSVAIWVTGLVSTLLLLVVGINPNSPQELTYRRFSDNLVDKYFVHFISTIIFQTHKQLNLNKFIGVFPLLNFFANWQLAAGFFLFFLKKIEKFPTYRWFLNPRPLEANALTITQT